MSSAPTWIAFAYFNNDLKGHAFRNATALREKLGG
jgi:hypothetical protein